MAISVATTKKLVLQRGTRQAALKAQRAKLTKRQIVKRARPKTVNPAKTKRAKLTKRQIAKRRSKGTRVAAVVNTPAVPANTATVKRWKPAKAAKIQKRANRR
jgi:hypothetical protein